MYGLTAGEWAREHGIDGRSLNAWRMNLARRTPVKHRADLEPRLVELVPIAGQGKEARLSRAHPRHHHRGRR
jgi:hypothetical protein